MSGQNNNDGFQQAMLKTALETTPQLSEENYSIWKDKMTALLQLRGVLTTLNDEQTDAAALADDVNAELILLFIAKIDSVTHNNVVTADNRNSARALWKAIKDRFASDESSNRARVFNKFLYVQFKEDALELFVTDIKVAIKKLVDIGIDLPQDILAYLILFKLPDTFQLLKRQIMHSDKSLTVKFVCDHLVQFNNENQAEVRESSSTNQAALISTKIKDPTKTMRDDNHFSDSCWHLHPDKAPNGGEKLKQSGNLIKCQLLYVVGHSLDKRWRIENQNRTRYNLELRDLDVIRTGKKDATLPIKGMGKVTLQWGNSVLTLDNCLYVPNIVINLVSAGALIEKGCDINAGKGAFRVSKCNLLLFKGKIDNNLFTIDNRMQSVGKSNTQAHLSATLPESLETIHEKYGHASIQRIEHLLPPIGPISPESKIKSRFILTLVDNYSGYLAGFPLVKKDDTTDLLINLLELEKKRLGYLPSLICSDGGGKFMGNRLVDYLDKNHIQRLISEPYHPEHNGRAERANRTIVESMRATFRGSGIAKNFWHEIVKSCCLALNQIPRKGSSQSPWKLCTEKGSFNISEALGTTAVVLNMNRRKGQKFDVKGQEGLLVGFNTSLQSYRIITQSGSIIDSKHVRFLKAPQFDIKMADWDKFHPDKPDTNDQGATTLERLGASNTNQVDQESPSQEETDNPSNHDNDDSHDSEEEIAEQLTPREQDHPTQISYRNEITSIENHDVWDNHYQEPPNPLDTTWVFKIKDNCHGDPLKHKARLCVQGFDQIEHVDHEGTFAPTGKVSTLKMIMVYALHQNLTITQFDVQGAFLHAPLTEEVYIKTPKGVNRNAPYLKLKKALYGLKTSTKELV
ncbi:hypothetical protein PSTT_14653 [Puccinia striiformis]|uniref:Integrase catalytic domain-containing protein n=1 Tax=Puccinia striiformis TaxID=27350 RepID=A0A2S4ULK9_9BASI|nr:hypothetical protein PSTT_14653 [Puccinia striiformis]